MNLFYLVVIQIGNKCSTVKVVEEVLACFESVWQEEDAIGRSEIQVADASFAFHGDA